MEDQFGGRTDDALFYDDLEPLTDDLSGSSQHAPSIIPREVTGKAAVSETTSAAQQKAPGAKTAHEYSSGKQRDVQQEVDDGSSQNPASSSFRPTKMSSDEIGAIRTKLKPSADRYVGDHHVEVRLQSGVNPRTRLTEDELAAKMERMKLLSAEKTRKHEKAENDEKQHAVAYARGMEEAGKRRAEEAERRKRGEENRKRMESEREKNRARKLKAMKANDGGWNEGQQATVESVDRRGLRVAYGDTRGTRNGGLDSSMYTHGSRQHHDSGGSSAKAPRGLRGRAPRDGRDEDGRVRKLANTVDAPASASEPSVSDLGSSHFPSLPSREKGPSGLPKTLPRTAVPELHNEVVIPSLTPSQQGGKWDEEVEAEEAELLQQKLGSPT